MSVVRLTLPFPPSENHYKKPSGRGRGRMYRTKEAESFIEAAQLIAKTRCARPLEGSLLVQMDVYRPTRRTDLTNCHKVALDSLQGFVYRNDRQITRFEAEAFEDPKNPRVELVIAERNAVGPLFQRKESP